MADEVHAILLGTSTDLVKNAKLLNASGAINAKIARFVADPQPKGVAIIIDAKKRAKMFEDISQFGITDVRTKQALCLAVLRSDIDAHVANKQKELTKNGSVALNEEQKTAFAGALVKYRNFIVQSLIPSIQDIAVSYGVLEEVKADVNVAAPAPAVAQ